MASDAGAGCGWAGCCFGPSCFGAAGGLHAVDCFGAAARFSVARFGAPALVGAASATAEDCGFENAARCGDRFGVLAADALAFDALAVDALAADVLGFDPLGFEGLRFDGLAFDSVGRDALARTLAPTEAFRGMAALARTCKAACAALAFFLACLAAFLLALANFRARLSTFLAARTCCFAASARATAAAASVFSRCTAAAWLVCASDDREVATVRFLAK